MFIKVEFLSFRHTYCLFLGGLAHCGFNGRTADGSRVSFQIVGSNGYQNSNAQFPPLILTRWQNSRCSARVAEALHHRVAY